MTKKIISLSIEESTVQRLDLLREEPVTRSELVDGMLQYLLENPDYIISFVKEIKRKIESQLPRVELG